MESKIDIKFRIPKTGEYHAGINNCPQCNYSLLHGKEMFYSHCIGIFEDGAYFVVMECPVCFCKYYFHCMQDNYDDFLLSIDLGENKHFNKRSKVTKRKGYIKMEEEIKKIEVWLRKYLESSKTNGYVIGLSGGVDSSVVVSLLVRAVGKKKVLGIIMPCASNPQDKLDAELVAKNLDIEVCTVDLYSVCSDLIDKLVNLELPNTRLANINIKPRLRMTVLYFVANVFNYLVAGTGNKSELMVGYFTKYGDGGVDLEPIGNFYKTEVFEMAKILGVPECIIKKKPSAGLYPGQTDEDDIGSYAELDKCLSEGIENTRISNLVRKNQHKNMLPPRYNRDR